MRVCMCVYVCERENASVRERHREIERERKKEI